MRLINAVTRELEYFDHKIPPYYILSHRWTNEEVSYKDFHKCRVTQGLGYEKIIKFCDFALMQNDRWFRGQQAPSYVWIDTCTIDKRSSTELSEAINSMYRYYADADMCYVYLADVFSSSRSKHSVKDHTEWLQKLLASEWFTRGWTLQELLAPRTVIFVNRSWQVMGHKCPSFCMSCGSHGYPRGYAGPNLNPILSSITGIAVQYLIEPHMIETASIARRMSWAAKRKTTRLEDEAYCLMGLFNINMPLLYGEGRKAFQRLQEEIIKHTTDMSIFAWTCLSMDWTQAGPRISGIFADRVSNFLRSGNIVPKKGVTFPFTLTNAGLHFRTLVQPTVFKYGGIDYQVNRMKLNCSINESSSLFHNRHIRYKSVEIVLLAVSDENEDVQGPKIFKRLDLGISSSDGAGQSDDGQDMSLYVMAFAPLDFLPADEGRRVAPSEIENNDQERNEE